MGFGMWKIVEDIRKIERAYELDNLSLQPKPGYGLEKAGIWDTPSTAWVLNEHTLEADDMAELEVLAGQIDELAERILTRQ